MIDFLKKYDDMGVFFISLDKDTIHDAVSVLCKEMGFYLATQEKKYSIYRCDSDERSFVLAVVADAKPFYNLSIKCKKSEKEFFFKCMDVFLQDFEDCWGKTKLPFYEYPDMLSLPQDDLNPFIYSLSKFGLI